MRALVFALVALTLNVSAQSVPILKDERGFVVCTGGGTQQPLFSKDCNVLNVTRVAAGGGIKYEGTCVDSNGILFLLVCDALNFEYQKDPSAGKLVRPTP